MPYDPYTGMPVPGPAWGPRPPARSQNQNCQEPPQPIQPAQRFIPGRTVQNIAEVVPQEVPMDGSVALFLMADLSAIFAKAWNRGTISTVKYVPEQISEPEPTPDPFQQQIFARLDAIEKVLKQPTSTESKTNKSAGGKNKDKGDQEE